MVALKFNKISFSAPSIYFSMPNVNSPKNTLIVYLIGSLNPLNSAPSWQKGKCSKESRTRNKTLEKKEIKK